MRYNVSEVGAVIQIPLSEGKYTQVRANSIEKNNHFVVQKVQIFEMNLIR